MSVMLWMLRWTRSISVAIEPAASLRFLGQLAHLVGDDGEALPCSPARAASIAALRASRLVWLGDLADRLDDPADPLRLADEVVHDLGHLGRRLGHRLHRLAGLGERSAALAGELLGAGGGGSGLVGGRAGLLDHPHLPLGALSDIRDR